jgi:hypothetical protein
MTLLKQSMLQFLLKTEKIYSGVDYDRSADEKGKWRRS